MPGFDLHVRKKPFALYVLVIILTLQSISALICGAAMMWEPGGAPMQLSLALLKQTPFNNFLT